MLKLVRDGRNLYVNRVITTRDSLTEEDIGHVQKEPFSSHPATIIEADYKRITQSYEDFSVGLVLKLRNEENKGQGPLEFTEPQDIASIMKDFNVDNVNDFKGKPAILYVGGKLHYAEMTICMSAPPALACQGILDHSISELDLSVRAANCLVYETDILTIGELAERTESDLLGLRNFGKGSLAEIKHKLKRHKLVLKER